MIEKIDAHGHFGKSYLGPESSLQDYLEHATQLGITICVASPGPSPEYKTEDLLYRPSIWRNVNGIIKYEQQYINDLGQIVEKGPSPTNPYSKSNRELINIADKLNTKSQLKIMVMPLHHPILDTEGEILRFINDPKVVAIKLHGVATFTSPLDVNPRVTKALSQTRKPLIVHTDLYRGLISNDINTACNNNHPLSWVEWSITNNIRLLITHGARLSKKAIKKINQHPELFIVGMSPDLLIMSEPNHIERSSNNFIKDLLLSINKNQLVFDIDFGWNVYKRDMWNKNDWDMCQRFEYVAQELGLSAKELEDIYYNNAARFYFDTAHYGP